MFEANNLYHLFIDYELSSNYDLSKPHVYQTGIAGHDLYTSGRISVILSCYLPEDTTAYEYGMSVICPSAMVDAYSTIDDSLGHCIEAILSTIDDIRVTPVRVLSCDSLLIFRHENVSDDSFRIFNGASISTDHGVIRLFDYNVYDSFPTSFGEDGLYGTQKVNGVTNRYFFRANTKFILGDTFSFKEWIGGRDWGCSVK